MTTNDNSVEILGPADDDENPVFSRRDMAILDKNRELRLRLIQELAGDGKVPEEKADKSMLLTLLSDVDNEVMQRNRLKVAAKIEKGNQDLTSAIAQALMQHRPGVAIPSQPVPKVLPPEIRLENPVPGEMDIGVIPLSYEELTGGNKE